MLLDGKECAAKVRQQLKAAIDTLEGRPPCLAVVLVGDNPASHLYVRKKVEACREVGVLSHKHTLPAEASEQELLAIIDQLNSDPAVDGILVQLPLPFQIDVQTVINRMDPNKDVDGFHPLNQGKLYAGDPSGFVPCTPLGILHMLRDYAIPLKGRHAVVIGRSQTVGRPMAQLLLQADCTVTVAHRHTPDLGLFTRQADLLVVAVGSPGLIRGDMVKEGVVVVDVGTTPTLVEGKRKVLGDVDFEAVAKKAAYISPVPGGVGPMTIAMLLENTLKSHMQKGDF